MSLIKDKRKLSEHSRVLKSLFELKVEGTLVDVQLCLPGHVVTAHACVLASCSSYFMDYFQLNQENHWCSKKPLIIDLEKVMGSLNDLCVSCVSKIIDFMYLRELVILQDHYEHFVRISEFLCVSDLITLGKKYNKVNLCRPFKNTNVSSLDRDLEKSQIDGLQLSDKTCNAADLLSQEAHVEKQSEDLLRSSPVSSELSKVNIASLESVRTTVSEIKESDFIASGIPHCKSNLNVNYSCQSEVQITSKVVDNSTEQLKSSIESEKEIKGKKICEFPCCNPETNMSTCKTNPSKRRKMLCEVCKFSSVSIRKFLQHLEITDHLGNLCPVCLRKIEDISDLKEHLKDHVNSKPFICHICGRRNRFWEYHKMHLKVHCKNKHFYCELCHRGFTLKRNLNEHLATHKGSYLCNKCDYYTSDIKMFKSHLLQHGKENSANDSRTEQFDCNSELKNQKERKFQCQVCAEKFTQKKNLTRHVKLKHFEATEFKCSLCTFITKRTDLLRHHMKKHHNCTLIKAKRKTSVKEKKLQKEEKESTGIVGVLIPVQLVSQNSTVNAFAVKKDDRDNLPIGNDIQVTKSSTDQNNYVSSSHTILHQHPKTESVIVNTQTKLDPATEFIDKSASLSLLTDLLGDNKCDQKLNSITTVLSKAKNSLPSQPEEQRSSNSRISDIQINLIGKTHSSDGNEPSSKPGNYNNSLEVNSCDIPVDKENNMINNNEIEDITGILNESKYIWLNETTGELLSDETFFNLHLQQPSSKTDHHTRVAGTGNSSLDFGDQFTLLNEATGEFSGLEIEDIEEWQYPQTPQANVVGLDDCDNLFPWNQLDNSFYSTWVLNETTGELNMVSFFSIQPLKSTTELKLDENTESLSSLEDDDTALFLNEGTGDLSVIYFNPCKPESSSFTQISNEQHSQERLETLSENSDDECDLLNEEFMKASASFMSNQENEKFLNELTGEFDTATCSYYQPDRLDSQVGDESYLNEETGEISWNFMDQSAKSDLFTNHDNLECDLDDSLHCEDFESFFTDITDFSSQFCLATNTSNQWHSTDETSDAVVLNECTGELVKRS